MIRVGVLGAGGRMGREVCRAVSEDPDLELSAAVDPALAGIDLRQVTGVDMAGLQMGASREDLGREGTQVAVDFTVADQVLDNLHWCCEHSVHAVVGTTGLSEAEMTEIERMFSSAEVNCILAPNFALGAVLMMRFAELAAPFMDGVEILELHHDRKLDAPSGTALNTARRLSAARSAAGLATWPADRTVKHSLPEARGAEGPGEVRIHSVRLPGLVAHQEVVFGAVGQSLSLRHDAYDRSSFMPGVLMAIKAVAERRGLTIGIDPLLGF